MMKNNFGKIRALIANSTVLILVLLVSSQVYGNKNVIVSKTDFCGDPIPSRVLFDDSDGIAAALSFRARKAIKRSYDLPRMGQDGSPLSNEEMASVMAWIAAKVTAERLSYCYQQSKVRGAGVPLTSNCPSGTEKNGQLCYPQCDEGYSGVGPVCWRTCPSGFTDIGAFCQKPAAEGRGAGYPWQFGDPLNLSGATSRCESVHGAGNCEQTGAIIYPKCKTGFRNVGANICSPVCPNGFNDTGTGCAKPSYGRGAGETLACPQGTEKNGLLCYKPCDNGYKGVGPVCWGGCPSQFPVECGVGCATSTEECVKDVKEKVVSVVQAAISLASLGTGSSASKMIDKFSEVTDAIENAQNTVEGIQTVIDLLEQVVNEFSGDFAAMTSDEINSQIDKTFSPRAALYIKKEWAKRHLRMTWKASTISAAKKIGSLVSIADPTGLSAVANAFANPICDDDTPFPEVEPLY